MLTSPVAREHDRPPGARRRLGFPGPRDPASSGRDRDGKGCCDESAWGTGTGGSIAQEHPVGDGRGRVGDGPAIRGPRDSGGRVEDHVDDVALLASELATNAVLHGARPIAVAVEAGGHRLRVEVSDAAPALPVELDLGPEIENGRGLAIVEAVADEWGAERVAGDGKVVWAELRDDDGAEPGAGKDGR